VRSQNVAFPMASGKFQLVQNENRTICISRTMTIKEQLLDELDQIPESVLPEVLEFVRSLKTRQQTELQQSDTWKAYLASKQQREEVYRRLANS